MQKIWILLALVAALLLLIPYIDFEPAAKTNYDLRPESFPAVSAPEAQDKNQSKHLSEIEDLLEK